MKYLYKGVKFRPVLKWLMNLRKKFLFWYYDTNLFMFFSRKLMFCTLLYYLIFDIKLNIIFCILLSYIINRLCWDIFTTWFYIDYVYGLIYEFTDDIKFDKRSLIISVKKFKQFGWVFVIKIYSLLVFIPKYLGLYYYFSKLISVINTLLYIYKYIYILILVYLIYNFNVYIILYISILFVIFLCFKNSLLFLNNTLINKILYLNKLNLNYLSSCRVLIYQKFKYMCYLIYAYIIYILNIISNIYATCFVFYNKILLFIIKKLTYYILNIRDCIYVYINYVYVEIYNLISQKLTIIYNENNKIEYYIYIYNKKVQLKKLKFKLNMYIIFILNKLEYYILNKRAIYKKRNILKLHRKSKSFKLFKSNVEITLNSYKIKFYKYLTNQFNTFIGLNSTLKQLIKNKSKPINIKFNLNLILLNNVVNYFKIYLNSNLISINKIIKQIYTPILILNFIISDTALSITSILVLYKKKYYINKIIIYVYIYLVYILKTLNSIYIYLYIKIKWLLYLVFSKTIYLTFVFCLFYNKDVSAFIVHNIYNAFLFEFINKYDFSIYINFIFNTNNMYYISLILGIQLVLYWSRNIHSLFGGYLWTMTIFPIFLEIHKLLYLKLLSINIFNINTFDFILLFKYNILELFNFKIYNLYSFISGLFLFILLFYFIKKGAFKHIYAKFNYSRWKFIKYPIYIMVLEIFRLKIIEYVSLYIMYINYKFSVYKIILNTYYKLSNNYIFLNIIDFIQEYVYDLEKFNYFYLFKVFNPNLYFLNSLIDILIIYVMLKWLVNYLNKYKKIDLKFVAFPLVMLEIIAKYLFIYLFFYYASIYLYIWTLDGTIVWHAFRSIVFIYIYLETRVHKIPRKTMPWYFRQIIELWPSTYLNPWYTAEYLYYDQQRYIVLRFRLKTFKIEYKSTYKKLEIWNKIIILSYQKEKDKALRLLSAYCRLMARKENMLREINNFEYQGWYEDWQYNHHKINIYNWKLDLWDKPYMYQFKKTIFFSNVRFFNFELKTPIEKFASKYMHLTHLLFIVNILDFYYTNKYVYILEKDDISQMNLKTWKKKFFSEFDVLEELTHLKKLKLVLMSFSSGENIRTPDWVFPPVYEKEYKKSGWAMFEDPRIDEIELDWRPTIHDLN